MEQYSNTAVYIRNATKSYGTKPVLQNLNMQVEKGTIYGLLGSSGCGKTTLLNCIVGRKKLDSGTVWVIGGTPGSKESGIPGPRVGFMPQEVALIAEFTVKSAIYYFGRVSCMSETQIKEKFAELTRLLDLPPSDRFISECSGGQQRRVSFAAALVSTPELLVLDEPTVGLDPLLRERIWDYLLTLTRTHSTSVIITTHYIEEARQANKVGLMRNGRLLAEQSPESLLNQYRTQSMEDVFLALSKNEVQEVESSSTNISIISTKNLDKDLYPSSTELSDFGHSRQVLTPDTQSKHSDSFNTANVYSLNRYRIKALFGKSWLQVSKNYSGLSFMVCFPILQIMAFFLAVGDDVKDIRIGICNHEAQFRDCENYHQNTSATPGEDGGCQFQQLGCYFLQQLSDPMFETVFYADVEKAKEDIRHGIIAGAIYIPENFSVLYHDKLFDGDYESTTLEYSQIHVWLDMSNRQIGAVLKAKLVDKIIEFQKSLFSDCNILRRVAKIPVNFDEHMYGELDDTFRSYMIPCVMLTTIFFLGSSNAANIILTDRLEGIWDRSIVAGVSTLEIVLVHFVSQLCMMVIQGVIILIIAFPIYNTENIGSFSVVVLITLLAGACGISYGFLVSILSNSHSMAHIVGTGGLFPLMVLSGLMWPVEGMPLVLQWISKCLPFTLPTISLRNVMKKGWSISHKDVVTGIGVEVVWSIMLVIISILEIKRKR